MVAQDKPAPELHTITGCLSGITEAQLSQEQTPRKDKLKC